MSEETNTEVDKKTLASDLKNVLDSAKEFSKELDGTPEETPKKSWFWIKNSNGQPSATITFLFIAFWVTTFIFIACHLENLTIGTFSIDFKDFDAAGAAIYYLPLMLLYFKRRETETK